MTNKAKHQDNNFNFLYCQYCQNCQYFIQCFSCSRVLECHLKNCLAINYTQSVLLSEENE